MRAVATAVVMVLIAAAPATASSPSAWEEFRVDVRKACVQRARQLGMKAPQVVVHPFGTQSHGIAVLIEGSDKRICLYSKAARTVELTS
jgi:hypothetical protein